MQPKMRLFADEWLTGAGTGKRFNATAAYAFAGYTVSLANPGANASKLLRHPEVQEHIRKHLDEYTMSTAEAMVRFTEIARSEVGDVVILDPIHPGDLKIDADAVIKNKKFIRQFGFDSNGNPKIEFHDALAALRDIAKIRNLLKDGIDVNSGGGPMNLVVQFVNPDGSTFNPTGAKPPEETGESFDEFDDA